VNPSGCLNRQRASVSLFESLPGLLVWWIGVLLLTCCLVPGSVRAGAASDAFDQANKLYEERKYSQAIAAYTKLLREKEVSAALYFNLGNAYFKKGQTGQAIVYYRLAERLAPRDPDIRANLTFARDAVGGRVPGGRWQRWLNLLTLNELTLMAAAVFWLWLLVLATGQYRRDWAPGLRTYRWTLGLWTLLFVAWLGVVLQSRLGSTDAVVVTREAVVRYGPFEEAQSFYTARDGTELAVLDHKDNWLQVIDGSRRVGWLPAKEVFLLPRG
jgi:tetratricopeptide (TPR) repeat protein